MEEHDKAIEPAEGEKAAIYSPQVVLVFSLLFSALSAGILTFYSLRDNRNLSGAWRALGFSVFYFAVTVEIIHWTHIVNPVLSIGLGGIGGFLLNKLFLNKYLPNGDDYPRKSWVIPATVWLIIAGAGMVVLIHKKGQ